MKITSKGQVTIPVEIRERFGLLPQTEVEFTIRDGHVVLRRPVRGGRPGKRGQALVEHLRGRATERLTTDEILALTREG